MVVIGCLQIVQASYYIADSQFKSTNRAHGAKIGLLQLPTAPPLPIA